MPPKITIVTPSYNQGKFLERTILSVINQNYPNLEYILIDGGSTDNSLQIIKKYQKYFTYYQIKKDHGQSDAIQQGFDRSTGKIMGWLNSDDILLPGSLQLIGQLFSQNKQLNWLTSQSFIINDSDHIVRTGIQFGKSRFFARLGFYHGKFLGFIPQEGTFWTRKLWLKSGATVPQKNQVMDFRLWQKFAIYSPLVNLEAPLAAFRLQPNQKTSSHTEYYREINPLLVYLPYLFRLVGRIYAPISRLIYPRIYFSRPQNKWIFKL